jgi:hypothetical protein
MSDMTYTPALPTPLATWLLLGFIAGFISVLTFHQGTIGLMYLLGFVANPPYNMTPRPPLDVPSVFSGAFWGGVWMTVFAAVTWYVASLRRTSRDLVIAGLVLGTVVIPLFNLCILGPVIYGRPFAFALPGFVRSVIIHGMFGLGGAIWMTVGLRLLARRNSEPA